MEGSVQDMETTVSSSDFSVGDIALLNDGKAKIPKKKPKGMQESKDFQEPRSEEEPDDEDIEESEEETRLVPFRAPSPGDFFSFLLVFWFYAIFLVCMSCQNDFVMLFYSILLPLSHARCVAPSWQYDHCPLHVMLMLVIVTCMSC